MNTDLYVEAVKSRIKDLIGSVGKEFSEEAFGVEDDSAVYTFAVGLEEFEKCIAFTQIVKEKLELESDWRVVENASIIDGLQIIYFHPLD